MNQESMMGKAARIYLMKMSQMVELDDVSEADRQELAKAFGAFCARLVRLAESSDAISENTRAIENLTMRFDIHNRHS